MRIILPRSVSSDEQDFRPIAAPRNGSSSSATTIREHGEGQTTAEPSPPRHPGCLRPCSPLNMGSEVGHHSLAKLFDVLRTTTGDPIAVMYNRCIFPDAPGIANIVLDTGPGGEPSSLHQPC